MGVKGLGGETAGMNSQELKHLELNSHVASLSIICKGAGVIQERVLFASYGTAT